MNPKNQHNESFLANKIGKKTGFSVPENYFVAIEDDFFGKLNTQNLPKKEGFTIPDGYFDTVENTIIEKIKNPKVISLKTSILRLISVTAAASILLFMGINYSATNPKDFDFENISSDDVALWLLEGYENVNTTDIAFVMETSDINELNNTNIILNNTDIEQYINNNIDTYTILNELK